MDKIHLVPNGKLKIPRYIPTVPSPLRVRYKRGDLPIVGVHAGKFFKDNGKGIAPVYIEKGVYSALNINPETTICLHFYVGDRTLEGFWQKRNDVYQELKTFGFYFVISPNFSVYDDSPRYEHFINISRTMIVYNELMENGINSIPDISWFDINDLDRWAAAINECGLKTIAYSFQAVGKKKRSNSWKYNMMGLRYLCDKINEDVGIVFVGITSNERLTEISQITGKRQISVINTFAFMRARSGCTHDSRQRAEEVTHDELFLMNCKALNEEFDTIFNK